jgi:hypothetical protein
MSQAHTTRGAARRGRGGTAARARGVQMQRTQSPRSNDACSAAAAAAAARN